MADRRVERRPRTGVTLLIKHSDPIALVGVALSCALAIALDLTGAATGVESLLAGLMGTTISLVLDASARAERRYRLRRLIEATGWLPGQVTLMASATAEITERYPGSEVEAAARRQVQQLVEELEELRRGRVVRHRDDFAHVIAATEACRSSLDAVTNVIADPHWWQSDLARHYWRANEAAIRRGVRIRRVFIYDQLTEELSTLVEEQRRSGAEVSLIQHRTLDPASLRNFIVWDGRSAWEGRMNAQAEIVSNVLVANAHEVDQFTELFRRCWESAHQHGPGP